MNERIGADGKGLKERVVGAARLGRVSGRVSAEPLAARAGLFRPALLQKRVLPLADLKEERSRAPARAHCVTPALGRAGLLKNPLRERESPCQNSGL